MSAQARGDVAVLRPCGVLDSTTYRTLRDTIIKSALDAPRAVLVDITELEVPAESALAVFTSASWHVGRWPEVPILMVCERAAGRLALVRNGITRYLPLYPTVGAATEAPANSGPPPYRRRARADLPAVPASLRRARGLVGEWLTEWSVPDLIPAAKVVVTTLVENVLAHTDSRPGLRLEFDGANVTVAVADASHRVAALVENAVARSNPSGLAVVAALCRAWGNAPNTSGKTVWAVLGPENILT